MKDLNKGPKPLKQKNLKEMSIRLDRYFSPGGSHK